MRGKLVRRVLVVGAGACAVVGGFALVRAMDGGPDAGVRPGSDRPVAAAAGSVPRSVAVRPTGTAGELKVTWSAPADPTVTAYRVAAEDGPVVEVAAPASTAVLTGLADEEATSVVVTARAGATEAPAAPVRGTPRSLGPGGCSGATITWDGGAGTTAWSTATNWDLDRVPVTTDHVCIPDGATVAAPNPRPTVLSLASGGTLSLPAGIALTDTATPSLLSDTTWSAGTVSGSVVVAADGDLVTSTTSTKTLQAHLVVDGTLRLDGRGTTVSCALGSPSGVDVAGVLDLAVDGTVLQGAGATCTPTVQVRAGAVLDKVAGTGTSTVETAVVVAGEARATTGTLALAGGSETVDWTGAATGAADGATTGTVGAAPGATVQLRGTGGRRTWHVAPGSVLAGAVTVATDGTLAGTGGVSADGVVRVTGGGHLAADLTGGTVRLEGGEWHGDVLPGVARVWQSGSLRGPGVTVATGATVEATGTTSVQTAVLNQGTIDVTTGALAVTCTLGQPSGVDNRGVIELDRDGSAVTGSTATGTGLCTATIWNRSTGTIRKVTGTGASIVETAVVNLGRVEATSGPLALRGGSETVSWNGATSGTGSGPSGGAGTGAYVGTAPGVVRLQGLSSTSRRVHRVAPGSSLAGVEVEQYGTLSGDGTVAGGAMVSIDSTGALAANLGGGTIRLAGGEWRGDVLVGEAREWSSGSVRGDQVKVRGGATVRVLGSVDLRTNLLNRGTVRVEASRLDVGCTPGTPSGIDNEGTVEVTFEGTAIAGTTSGTGGTCTSTLWNRGAGILRKPSGTGLSTVQVAVVNDGIVTAHTGTLALVGGSAYTGWNGATTGTGSETSAGAGTGIYRSNGTAVVRLGGPSSVQRRTHTLAPGAAVNGTVEIGTAGTLAGAATVGTTGSVGVAFGGVLEAALTGGAVHLDGGILRADVGAGSTHTWSSGTVEAPAAVVPAGTTVAVDGAITLATALANHGTIRFPVTPGSPTSPGSLTWACAAGTPWGLENHGLVETLGSGTPLRGSTVPGGCTSTFRNRPTGTFRQAGGAVVGTVTPAVVNEGAVVATAGTLRLSGGTVNTDAAGVTTTGAATGSYHSTGSARITMIDRVGGSPTYHHVAGAELGGLVELSAELLGWGTVAGGGTLEVAGGTLDAELTGGTVRMVAGEWRADVLPGEHREWDDGAMVDDDEIEVRAGATLTVTGANRLDTQLLNRGTLRIESSLRVWCRTGLPSSVDNRGVIDLAAVGPLLSGIDGGCTPTVQNRAGATVRKTVAGWSAVDVALVNHGLVHAQAGDLALRGGSPNIDWDGTATGLDPGLATGEYRGDPGTISLEGGEGCCGAVDPVSTHHLAPVATIDGAMEISAAILEGSATLTEDAVVTISGGTLAADLGGGTIVLDEGVWAADVLPGVAREWRYGSLQGDVEVVAGAAVLLDQSTVRVRDAHLVNRGLVRIVGGKIEAQCQVGGAAGIDNHGEISMGTNGWIAPMVFSSTDCTPTVWNRPTGTIVADGTGTARFGAALVNEGEVRAEAGTLSVEGGTEWESWDGTAGTSGTEAPTAGTWAGDGGTIDFGSSSPCCAAGSERTYHLRGDDTLAGDLVVGRGAIITGPDGDLEPGSLVTVEAGVLDMSLAGGTIVLDGGRYSADALLAGEDTPPLGAGGEPTRIWRSGRFGDPDGASAITVHEDAELHIDGEPSALPHTILENEGTVVWPGDSSYFMCDTCTFLNPGDLNLVRATTAPVPDLLLVDAGQFDNTGLVHLQGEFPGVMIEFTDGVEVSTRGQGISEITRPAWAATIEDDAALASLLAANGTRSLLVGALLNQVISPKLGTGQFAGVCAEVDLSSFVAGLGGQVCTITDDDGADAISLTLGARVTLGVESFLPFGFDVSGSGVFGWGVDTTNPIDWEDMGGLFVCNTGSVLGFSGSHCWGPESETTFDLPGNAFDLSVPTTQAGVHAAGAGTGGILNVSTGLSWTSVIPCDTWTLVTSQVCPVRPEVEEVDPAWAYQSAGNRSVVIHGAHLTGATTVEFRHEGFGGTERCYSRLVPGSTPRTNGTIDVVLDDELHITLPTDCPIVGPSQVIVTTEHGGDNEVQIFDPGATFTWIEDPPP